jgi:hypothetical protein
MEVMALRWFPYDQFFFRKRALAHASLSGREGFTNSRDNYGEAP